MAPPRSFGFTLEAVLIRVKPHWVSLTSLTGYLGAGKWGQNRSKMVFLVVFLLFTER